MDEEDEEEDFSPSKGDHLYHLNCNEYIWNIAIEVAIKDFKQKKKMFEEVAPEYIYEYKDMFAKESFDVLPPRRPWNHATELLPGDHEVNCKVYSLNPSEKKELDDFLAENLKLRCIQPSKSPFTSAFFFIKKKDDCLWPIQDYWKLNTITCCNWYPLPLINKLVDKLKSAKYYTKFDVRWGYNNVWMAEVAIKDFEQKKKKMFKEVAPEYVHEYKDMFTKESFDVLPPRRSWDHAIELLPDDHEVDCKVYPLNPSEQKELDNFLVENLKLRCIQPSKSPFTSAFFFITMYGP